MNKLIDIEFKTRLVKRIEKKSEQSIYERPLQISMWPSYVVSFHDNVNSVDHIFSLEKDIIGKYENELGEIEKNIIFTIKNFRNLNEDEFDSQCINENILRKYPHESDEYFMDKLIKKCEEDEKFLLSLKN